VHESLSLLTIEQFLTYNSASMLIAVFVNFRLYGSFLSLEEDKTIHLL